MPLDFTKADPKRVAATSLSQLPWLGSNSVDPYITVAVSSPLVGTVEKNLSAAGLVIKEGRNSANADSYYKNGDCYVRERVESGMGGEGVNTIVVTAAGIEKLVNAGFVTPVVAAMLGDQMPKRPKSWTAGA